MVNKTDVCDKNYFKKVIDENVIDQLDEERYEFILDLQKFNNNCYESNYVLSRYNYLLRVFEIKNKFRHLTMIEPKKQNIVTQISICLTEKYNGFQTISTEFSRRERKKFKPIDIIYQPTKNPEIRPLCYYTEDISKAYTNIYDQKDKTKRDYSCYECYYCRHFF